MTLRAALSETLKDGQQPCRLRKFDLVSPFHLCHGQTLLCDEVMCERRERDAVCVQRVAGGVMGFRLQAAPAYISPMAKPRDGVIDGCLARLMSRVVAVIRAGL